MMNSRWQANKIGLINFWYYDEQEFPFVKGRMLLRGSNGSGKSVTMQSVVPLLLDGNMSPERLDPFGSRDRKMSSYLLEEDDGREERTGYLYLEFKRQDTDTYLTIGIADRYEQAEIKLENAKTQQKEQEKKLSECRQNIEKLQAEHQELDAKHESMEKERESLNKSDAVALKRREAELTTELEGQQKNLREMILGNLNYSDAIDMIREKRNSGSIITSEREEKLDYKFVNALVAGRLLEWAKTEEGKVLRLAEDLDSAYLEQLKRLMVYAVDISKSSNKKDNNSLPLLIKAVSVDDNIGNKELSEICIRISENPKIVQGDYIILVKNDFCCIANYMVYQVISVRKSDAYLKVEIAKHSFINKDKEDEILKDLKEAYYGKCE